MPEFPMLLLLCGFFLICPHIADGKVNDEASCAIDAALELKGDLYFFKDSQYAWWSYNNGENQLKHVGDMKEFAYEMPTNIDAAVAGNDVDYIFKGKRYWKKHRFDGRVLGGDKGYPLTDLSSQLTRRVVAAAVFLEGSSNNTYFFLDDNTYARYTARIDKDFSEKPE